VAYELRGTPVATHVVPRSSSRAAQGQVPVILGTNHSSASLTSRLTYQLSSLFAPHLLWAHTMASVSAYIH